MVSSYWSTRRPVCAAVSRPGSPAPAAVRRGRPAVGGVGAPSGTTMTGHAAWRTRCPEIERAARGAGKPYGRTPVTSSAASTEMSARVSAGGPSRTIPSASRGGSHRATAASTASRTAARRVAGASARLGSRRGSATPMTRSGSSSASARPCATRRAPEAESPPSNAHATQLRRAPPIDQPAGTTATGQCAERTRRVPTPGPPATWPAWWVAPTTINRASSAAAMRCRPRADDIARSTRVPASTSCSVARAASSERIASSRARRPPSPGSSRSDRIQTRSSRACVARARCAANASASPARSEPSQPTTYEGELISGRRPGWGSGCGTPSQSVRAATRVTMRRSRRRSAPVRPARPSPRPAARPRPGSRRRGPAWRQCCRRVSGAPAPTRASPR